MPTTAEIEAAKTKRGGWTREQLAQWGVPWPPPKGWKAALISSRAKMRSDTDRLDWLEKREGFGLISDDAGRWAVSGTGTQNVPDKDVATDIATSFFVEKSEWKPTIREAIDAAMDDEAK